MQSFGKNIPQSMLDSARYILEGKNKKESLEKDPGEYDYEGSMAKNQLRTIIRNAKGLHDQLLDDENLPEWAQQKIAGAEEDIVSVRDYIESEKEKQNQ